VIEDKHRSRFSVRDGDILFARSGATVGKSFLICGDNHDAVFASYLIRVRFDQAQVDPRYAYFFFASKDYWDQVNEGVSGTGQPNFNGTKLAGLRIPVPPLVEQRGIVAQIEALFARTRRARTDLQRIAPLASRYREQRRKRAFDEDANWKLIGDAPRLPAYAPPTRFDELRTIPVGWQWAEIAAVSDVGGGLTKNQTRANNPIEIPYLRVANVYADELRLDNVETIRVSQSERDRIGLLPGDLLVVEGNGSVDQIGRVAVWDGSIPNCGHQNHLIRVRPRDGIPPRFILHWLMSPYGRSVLETVASSSSGLHTLSLSKVAAIPMPIPPVETAKKVATSLDQAATQSAHVQREAVRALALLDRLEQSILARAFRGELVPQSLADDLEHPAQAVDPIVTASPRRRRRAAA
jgi:type I restriction enzyme S subunit